MILWLIFAAMALLAIGCVVLPLFRRATAETAPARADYDVAVYRDQLRDIERDRARGVIDEQQAAAARLEVERRLLAAADQATTTQPPPIRRAPWPIAIAVALILLPGAGLIYLQHGAPWLADGTRPAQQAQPSFNDLIAELERRLQAAPDDGRGWVLLARGYARQGRLAEALTAQERAVSLAANDEQAAEIAAGFGQILVEEASGTVTPEARAAFAEAIKRNPRQMQARYFTGLAKAQDGDTPGALAEWQALIAESPADAPWRAGLQAQIAQLEGELAAPEDPAASQAMIETMVANLAARLDEQKASGGGSAEDWARLGRSYRVLGRKAEARDAYGEAVKRAPDDVTLRRDYVATVGEADGETSPTYVKALTALRDRLPMGSSERAAIDQRLKSLP